MIVNNSINFVKAKTEDLNNGLAIVRGKEDNLDTLLEIKEGETVVPVINIGNQDIAPLIVHIVNVIGDIISF